MSNVYAEGLAIVWCLCPRRLVGGGFKVTTVQTKVIYISDELNVEKSVVPNLNFHVDDIVVDRSVTPEFSHIVEMVGVGNAGGSRFLGFGRGGDVVASEDGDQGSSYVGFFPHCSLKDDSHLSLFETTIGITKNVFPYRKTTKMVGYSLSDLVRSLHFVATQRACFFLQIVLIGWICFW